MQNSAYHFSQSNANQSPIKILSSGGNNTTSGQVRDQKKNKPLTTKTVTPMSLLMSKGGSTKRNELHFPMSPQNQLDQKQRNMFDERRNTPVQEVVNQLRR